MLQRIEPGFFYDREKKHAELEVTKPGTQGRTRKRLTLHGVTRQEAEAKWRELRAEVIDGEAKIPETFGEFIAQKMDEHLRNLASTKPREEKRIVPGKKRGPKNVRVRAYVPTATTLSYEYLTNVHLLPYFGRLKLKGITVETIKSFIRVMREKAKKNGDPLSEATINGALRVLRKWLHHAYNERCLSEYPRGKWTWGREEVTDGAMTGKELDRFFAAFDGTTFTGVSVEAVRNARPFFILAAETGLRRGDLMSLTWQSVNIPERVIAVTMRKTGKPIRIPITAVCLAAFQELKGRKVVSPTSVFLGVEGTPLPWVTIRRVFSAVKGAAGITRRVRLHDFRHGVAHRLNDAGASAFTIMQTLGHTSMSTTARYTQADTTVIAGEALERTAWKG